MISWIQKYFQHHFRTIFAVLLGLIIISFVFTIGATPGLGRAERRAIDRKFFSYNLGSQEGQQRLMGDASLSVNLQVGSMGGIEPDQVQNYALQRAAALSFADQLHIPAPTTAEITDFIKGLRAFAGTDGQFDAKAYEAFRLNLRTNPRFTEAEIARVIADDVRAEKVQKLIGGPGYVLPGDVALQLKQADTTWSLATAAVDYAGYKFDLKPSDAELTKFFGENAFRYKIPERVVVSFVAFPAADYLGSVSVTEAEVRAYYDANPARFPKPSDLKFPAAKDVKDLKPADPAENFAAVRQQVETALKLERAQRLAVKAASDFVFTLYERKIAPGPALDAVLAAQKLTRTPLAPFTQEEGPVELGGSPEIAAAAFQLNKDHYYTEALPGAGRSLVLFWQETQPSRDPLFTEVRSKVAADYLENEKRKRFVELGRTLRSQLEARLKAGDTFEKAVAASNSTGMKVDVKTIPPFTARNRPQDLDYSVLGALERLEKGQVSDMIVTADKGIFVYALDKKAPDLAEANPLFASTRAQLANYSARLTSGALIGEVVEKELKKSEAKPQ